MAHLLVVENDPRDVRIAERVALHSGFSSITTTPSADAARALLKKAQDEGLDKPDAILLDLDLGTESGFDFLRVRYDSPWLLKIPLVVWTKLGDHNENICTLFKVQEYVSKSAGDHGLYKALENIMRQPSQDK